MKDPAMIGGGTAVGLRRQYTDLKAKINAALAAMHQDEAYDKMSHK